MANAFAAGASGASWDLLTETAYDREVEYQLRDMPQWRQITTTKPKKQAMPGDVVVFTIHKDLSALATTPLTETVDPDAVAPQAPTRVPVTLNEYGNATLATLRLEATAFTQPDVELANLVGRNMYDTLDSLVKGVADTSTNTVQVNGGVIKTTGGTVVGVTPTDIASRNLVATTVALLRRDKVVPLDATNYVAIAHGDVIYDLMAENSATAWNAPHTVGGDTAAYYAGEVGTFQGARFIRTNRVTTALDGSSGTTKVYRTYVLGQQAIAEADAIDPHVVIGPQVDKLKRFFPLGWYGLLGWALYRPEALRKVHTSSSLGALA